MKNLSAAILATVAVLVTGSAASAQVQQASHCDCNNGGGNYIGYQASDWSNCNHCQTGNHSSNRQDRVARRDERRAAWANRPRLAHPDSGWAPPTHYPVNYDSMWYATYHPQAYYGNPGGGFIGNYPAVYQPNDTTQLGYTYMNVPTWQSHTGVIPGVPYPGNFHHRGCNYGCNGGCQTCDSNMYSTPNGSQVVRQTGAKPGFFTRMRLASFTDMFD